MISTALGCFRRRVVCAILCERDEQSLLIDELATETAARQHDVDRASLSSTDVRAVRTSLHHVHLPKLSSIGAVTIDDGRVRARESHPLFADDTIGTLLDDAELIRRPELDETVSILGDRRKRALLTEIASVDVALTRQSLAVRIASRETAKEQTQTSLVPSEVYHSLHHVHIPHFESLGLLEDDREQGTVRVAEPVTEVELADDVVDVIRQVTAAITTAEPADA